MLEQLSKKILTPIRNLGRSGAITEASIRDAVKEIRMALLEADVHFKVVKDFLAQVEREAIGEKVLKSISPGQQFTKIVHDSLVKFLGGEGEQNAFDLRAAPPVPVLLVGLQGSGKTTTAGKLAYYLKKKEKKRVLLVPCDPRRPAAKEQLKILAEQAGVDFYDSDLTKSPAKICKAALEEAKRRVVDVLIVDTAGRLSVDDALMEEIRSVREALQPKATMFVADSMTGQEAVNVAQSFHSKTPLSGIILTKLDGDARGGAALSIKYLTGVPIAFVGMGEGITALEVFHPERLASRILDMGDILSLVEKAQENINQDEVLDSVKNMRKGKFTLEDFLKQMHMMSKLGSMQGILKMLPGGGQMAEKLQGMDVDKDLKRMEAIIFSMTLKERRNHKVLNGSRRARIAAGSGTTVAEVNRLVKRFEEAGRLFGKFFG